MLHLGPPCRGGIPSREMAVKYPKQLLLPFTGGRSMGHGLRGGINPKGAEGLGDEAHRPQRAQAKPQIPIGRIPESAV